MGDKLSNKRGPGINQLSKSRNDGVKSTVKEPSEGIQDKSPLGNSKERQ